MKIYWIKAQAPLRVLALAKHLGMQAEFINALRIPDGGLKSAEYVALNPNMKAPTLVDGETVLWEASAIMTYLCIKAGSNMWPANHPAEQVEVVKWLSWNDCHWMDAVGNFYFQHIVKATFKIGEPDREALKGEEAKFRTFAKVLDMHLADHAFVACGRLTIADFQLASMARYWREAEMPMAEFTNVVRWLDELMKIPAWADPWPTV